MHLPGGAQPPPKQTIYPAVRMTVASQPGAGRVLLVDTPTDGQLAFPMDLESCRIIGQALLAPGVVVPNGGPPAA